MESRIPESETTALTTAFKDLYDAIATSDVAAPIQDLKAVESHARQDADNIGEVVGFRALEIGPGHGYLARELEKRGATVSACDLVPQYLERLAGDVSGDVFLADAQSLSLKDEFDLVVMCDVLEHVLRPADALNSAYEALRPGGRLYVRTPNYERLTPYSKAAGCPWEVVHLRTYTPALLKAEVLAIGFRALRGPRPLRGVQRTRRDSFLTPPRYWRALLQYFRDSYAGAPVKDPLDSIRRSRLRYYALSGERPARHAWVYLITRPLYLLFTREAELWILAEKPTEY